MGPGRAVGPFSLVEVAVPIKIPNDLPAFEKLEQEGVQLIAENEARRQDVRPMQVALLNLMPDKPKTETQLARLLGATPLQVELTLLTTSTYRPNTVPLSHLQSFYKTWDEVRERKFDGLIITGAPVELMPFEEVRYWDELTDILNWSRTNVHSSFHICWGAQAALYHFHGVPKHTLPTKRFGIYTHYLMEQRDARRPALMRGFDDYFLVPVSRHTEVRVDDLPKDGCLEVLAQSNAAGLCLLHEPCHRTAYMFNHLEYDTYTLHDEFVRDRARRPDVSLPISYYPEDDPQKPPRNRWRAYAHLLFGNWINEMYQTTPYDLEQIGQVTEARAA
jgi:homoserine O-succinyltransferase